MRDLLFMKFISTLGGLTQQLRHRTYEKRDDDDNALREFLVEGGDVCEVDDVDEQPQDDASDDAAPT